MTAPALSVRWDCVVDTDSTVTVLPDGCRDILILHPCIGPPTVLLTDWDHQPRLASLQAGTHITGYRLRPGVTFDPAWLSVLSADLLRTGVASVEQAIASEARFLPDIDTLLPGPSSDVRKSGRSKRTLQREFQRLGLPPPGFWRQLGRVRAAARHLAETDWPLADLADHCGFSDQAHMTRALVRWFGTPPALLRRSPDLLRTLGEPGFGNWTIPRAGGFSN